MLRNTSNKEQQSKSPPGGVRGDERGGYHGGGTGAHEWAELGYAAFMISFLARALLTQWGGQANDWHRRVTNVGQHSPAHFSLLRVPYCAQGEQAVLLKLGPPVSAVSGRGDPGPMKAQILPGERFIMTGGGDRYFPAVEVG